MPDLKFSIIIPYKRRLENAALVFESLANQTLPASEFEVVVGAMEYCERYVALCGSFSERLTIVSVLSGDPWQVAKARNLAIRQATGQVLVLLDADMILPPTFLADLYERFFAYQQKICVVGQMLDYDNNSSDVDAVAVKPYQHYQRLLDELATRGNIRDDPRMNARHVIPWSFAWTALLALPSVLVREHDLLFDPEFHGYGVEDLEWAYRVSATGTPILMGHDVYGIHLPHVRNVNANHDTEAVNFRLFLRKWPTLEVELACALGDFAANEAFPEFQRAVSRAASHGQSVAATDHGQSLAAGASGGQSLAIAAGRVKGEESLIIGLITGSDHRVADRTIEEIFDPGTPVEVLPITGIALPYKDNAFAACRVLGPIGQLDERYRNRVLAEALRVAREPARVPGIEDL